MTSTDPQASTPQPEQPRCDQNALFTLTVSMLLMAMTDVVLTWLWPDCTHWVDLGVAVLTPLVVEVIKQFHDRHDNR